MRHIEQMYLRQQVQLKANGNQVYLKLMAKLCTTHRHFTFLRSLNDAIRAKDFYKMVNAADFLSQQKYGTATEHFVANQMSLLVRKYPYRFKGNSPFDAKGTAIASFLKSEESCRFVNRKFARYNNGSSVVKHELFLDRARNFIKHVLGPLPNIESILSSCDFGPGASLGVHGDATSLCRKILAREQTVTPSAMTWVLSAISRNHQLSECFSPGFPDSYAYSTRVPFELLQKSFIERATLVKHNKISFVPKTVKTLRSVATEPLWNGFLQKGIDTYMRKCLYRVGINLRDQSLNQQMAREGSTDDSPEGFVTLDLSAASDSLSEGVVRNLLPPEWYSLLDSCRSKEYLLDKTLRPFEKFCSMGNGFCFPLETLIFASVCSSLSCGEPGRDFSVYGDDIIVRKKFAQSVVRGLRAIGFRLNRDKSFVEGPFRESCGADWFGGKDVRPFTLDFELNSVENIFKFLNLTNRSELTTLFFSDVRRYVENLICPELRFKRPFKGQADTGIDCEFDEFLSNPYAIYKNGTWTWIELRIAPVVDIVAVRSADSAVGMLKILSGGLPHGNTFLPEFTFRRKTVTKVVRNGYVSTSNWLPPHSTR